MRYWLSVSTCLAFLCFAQFSYGGGITITDPWVAEPPPGARMLGGFMQIVNDSEESIDLVKVSGADFGMVEMHRTVVTGDRATMIKQEKLTIGAGQTLILEPGSYHLMLMMPKKNLQEGDSTELSLIFDKGEEVVVSAPVRKKTR